MRRAMRIGSNGGRHGGTARRNAASCPTSRRATSSHETVIQIVGMTKTYVLGDIEVHALRGVGPDDRARRVRRDDGRVGLGQIDADEHARMPGPAHQRPLHPRGRGRRATRTSRNSRRSAAGGSGSFFRISTCCREPSALENVELPLFYSALDRRRRASRRRPGEAGRTRGPRAEPSESTLGRTAAARRDCARAGQSPVDTAGRRADRQSRLDQFGRDNGRAAPTSIASRASR